MDFIERWFHVAPDGGDGTLELFLGLFLLAALVALLARRRLAGIVRWASREARTLGVRVGWKGPYAAARRRFGRGDVA